MFEKVLSHVDLTDQYPFLIGCLATPIVIFDNPQNGFHPMAQVRCWPKTDLFPSSCLDREGSMFFYESLMAAFPSRLLTCNLL